MHTAARRLAPPVRRPRYRRALCALGLALAATPARGQIASDPAHPRACIALTTEAERLACYDQAFDREAALAAPATDTPEAAAPSLLDRRWELLPESKLGTFGMRAYQPVYVLPFVASREANQTPDSPTPGRTVTSNEGLTRSEVEFQLSLKTKAWQGVFGQTGDLWLAYTQSSRWQLYNSKLSRPFRESNYEPEILLVFATRYRLFGLDGRLFALGLNHQSNGRDNPRSRGWSRVTASVGLERGGWTLTVRPWWRIPETATEDDNPDIEDFLGRADVRLVRRLGNHELAALVRHSLRRGRGSHGAVQVDWAFPIRGNLRGHVLLFHGYGESLIDYNFRSTRLGLGFSLIEWY